MRFMTKHITFFFATVLAISVSTGSVAQTAAGNQPATKPASVATTSFARVNGREINFAEYNQAAQEAVRKKYYHAQPPEAEVAALLREVGQGLIDQVLLGEDVNKRKISPDAASVEQQLAAYEKQYAASPAWQQQRQQTLPRLREHLMEKSKKEVLEKQVRSVVASEKAVREFYEANHDKFTEPEKVKLSVILLKVDPSSGSKVWEATRQEAEKLHKQLESGTKFEEMARLRSNDKSAPDGGDIGYVHRGMLDEQIHKQLDVTPVGGLSKPVVILEGVMIFRLDGRKLPELRPYADVKERAKALLERDLAEAAWSGYLKKLRAAAKVELSEKGREIMNPPAAAKAKK
jgi:parvulin-like peptidyl-prolyl isomerase